MATKPERMSGFTKPEYSASSGQVDERRPCAPCSLEGQQKPADRFCQDCDHPICTACVQQHGKFQALRDHKIMHLSAAATSAGMSSFPRERCSDHDGKPIDMYCADHDEIACTTCVNIRHRTCDTVRYIPDVAKGITKGAEYRNVFTEIQTSLAELKLLEKSAMGDIIKLEEGKTAALNAVTNVSASIKRQLEKLDKHTREEIVLKFDREAKAINEFVERCGNDIGAINKANEQLRNKDNDSDVFTTVKLVKHKMRVSGEMQQRAAIRIGKQNFNFKANNDIEDMLQNMTSLGSCVYTGISLNQHNIRTSDDRSSCHISGIAKLPDGRTIITDWDNKAVKLLDHTYKVMDRLTMPSGPDGVCCVGNDEVVVTLLHRQKVQFIKVLDKLETSREINLGEPCHCVAHHNGKLYIACYVLKDHSSAKVLVYSVSGRKLSEFNKIPSGEKIFSTPIGIIVSEDGENIYVTDVQKGIISLDSGGRVLSTLPITALSSPRGIARDFTNQLLVCSRDSHSIMQLGSGNVVVGTVLQKSDGLNKPTEIFYDASNGQLLVSMWESDVLHVFDFWL